MEPSAFGKNHYRLHSCCSRSLFCISTCLCCHPGWDQCTIQRWMGSLDSSLLMEELPALSSQPL